MPCYSLNLTGADTGGTWSGPVDGVYTYTVAATSPCTTEDTATVTVTIQDAPEAGTNGTLTVCEGTNITDAMLFAELTGADEGGTWSGPVDGVYTYTVAATAPCTTEDTATVTVTIQDAPEAGTNGTLTVCEGTNITDAMLFAELTGADEGGTWSGPVNGVYTYTVAATAPCTTEDTATVTVTIQDAPEAGTNGTLTVCEGTNITDAMLFAELTGADEGGTWSGPVDGVYTYTVAATSPCTTEDTATVTVTIQDAPEAGTSGTLTVCEGTTITDAMLFAELSGADENGTWSGPVDGVYTYTVAATSPCTTEDTATVTVTIQDAPEAGTSGTLTVCEGTTITDAMLFAELTGADTGGTWSGPVDGVYTYTVAATAPCTTEDTATVTVTIQDAPEAGTNGTLTVCEGTTITDAMLFAELTGADTGGTWSGPVDGVYTYTVAATAPCDVDATSTVTVTVQQTTTPVAGTVTQPTCEVATGSFSITAVDGMTYSFNGGDFGSATSWSELTADTYTVVAKNAAGCVSAELSVTINAQPGAPAPIQTRTDSRCIDETSFKLSDLLVGDYDTSGTWEDPMNTGALSNGFVNPSLLELGDHTFNYVISNGACSSTTEVVLSINDDCIVLACGIDDIKGSISKAVTPNGDNINDTFEIALDLDCQFTYGVKIFNRWGNMVFESNNYGNNWDGTSQTSVTGSQLPSGTYFYIVEIKNSSFAPIQGYIYLGTK